MILISIVISTFHYFNDQDEYTYFSLYTLTWFVLTGAVVKMRKTIKSTNFVLPNDNLICWHLILLSIAFLSRIIREALYVYTRRLIYTRAHEPDSSEYNDLTDKIDRLHFCLSIFNIINIVDAAVSDIFLAIMALRFAREQNLKKTQDPILKR